MELRLIRDQTNSFLTFLWLICDLFMDFVGNALKCYKGRFTNYRDAQPIEPKLVDCKRNEVLCASGYAKTDLTSEYGPVTAGSWDKACFKKSDRPEISEQFGNGVSDRCIEPKKYVKLCNINP